MKRFLIIFVIAFSGLVATIGGILGIKYLSGEFTEPEIMPQGIAFELDEYLIDGSLETYQVKITASNEDSTKNKIKLSFVSGGRLTDDKNHYTDGNITIPVNAEIGKAFNIQIVKDKSHTELLELGYTGDWAHGGVSHIVASSENIEAQYAHTNIFVDVPVYSTELVMYSNDSNQTNFSNIYKNIEASSLAINLNEESEEESKLNSISAGQDVYFGVKFYPYASAFRYSKIDSTNVLESNRAQISALCNSKDVNFDELFAIFSEDATGQKSKNVIESYKNTISQAKSVLGSDFTQLINNYESNLKYTNIVETGNNNKLDFIEKISGTNIYKFKSNTTLGSFTINSYAFKTITTENQVLANATSNLLTYVRDEVTAGRAFQNTGIVNVVDVEVDTLGLTGSIGNFYINTEYYIYADAIGINNTLESYLKLILSNSDLPTLDLQSKIKNIGIKFERRGINGWTGVGDDISILSTHQQVEDDFYLLGNNDAWVICANRVGAQEYRAVIKYFIFDDDEVEQIIALNESRLPVFTVSERAIADEQEVYWLDNSPISITVVNLVLADETTLEQNPEYDLNALKYVDRTNAYQSVRYFIYAEDDTESGEKGLHNYFNTTSTTPTRYILADGKTRYLYELDSSTLKLKSVDNIPDFETKLLFATVKIDLTTSVSEDGYEFVKVSSNPNTGLIDEIPVTATRSLTNISGESMIYDANYAGTTSDSSNEVKVANNKENVLLVKVESTDTILENAYNNGQITVVAKVSSTSAENYVSIASSNFVNDYIEFILNVSRVSIDTEVSLFIVYTINNQSYLYPISITEGGSKYGSFTIVANTENTIAYNLLNADNTKLDLTDLDNIEITYSLQGNELAVNYTYNFKDNTSADNVGQYIFDDGYIKHSVYNFLGTEIAEDNWYLTTDDASVIGVGDGKSINPIKTGTADITIHLKSVSDSLAGDMIYRTIKFFVNNTGFVDSYTLKDDLNPDGQTMAYTQESPFPNNGLTATIFCAKDEVIELDGTKADGILKLTYSFASEPVPINFSISIDNTSEEAFKAITGNDDLGGATSFKLNKTLGSDVSIKVIYYNSLLNLNVVLTLIIKAQISLTEITVKDAESIELTPNTTGNIPLYTVYAESDITIEAILSDSTTANYIYNNEEHSNVFNFAGNDVSTTAQNYKTITISNTTSASIGDLIYKIQFKIESNLKLSNYAISGVSVNLDKSGKIDLPILNVNNALLERFIGNAELEAGQLSITITDKSGRIAEYSAVISENNLQLDYSSDKKFENVMNTVAFVTYCGKSLGSFNLTIRPYNYEKETADRICYFQGEKAILLLKGEEASTVIGNQFVDGSSISAINGLMDVFNDGKVIGIANSLLYDTNANNKKDWNYIYVEDAVGNKVQYYLVLSQVENLDDFLSGFKNSNNPETSINLKDTDIYEMLYIYDTKENLLQYYVDNNIKLESYCGGNDSAYTEVGLIGLFPESFYKDDTYVDVEFIGMPGEIIGNYITLSNDYKNLYISSIGFDSAKVLLTLKYKNGSYTYSIPRIIEVTKSQKISINYEYDERDVTAPEFIESFGEYGSEQYDAHMADKETEYFTTIPYEYESFGTKNSVDINVSNAITTLKYVNGENPTWEKDDGYNSGYIVYVEKVYVLTSGDNYQEVLSGLDFYANVFGSQDIVVQVNRLGNVKSVRVKLNISTMYGAVGYYYIQVDTSANLPYFTLQKITNSTSQSVQGVDNLTINTDNVVYAGGIVTVDNLLDGQVYYKLDSYENELMFKVKYNNETDPVCGVADYENKTFTVGVVPNGGQFVIELYTRYGLLATINTNVPSYYLTEKNNDITIYGGVTYSAGDLVIIKHDNTEVTDTITIQEDTTKTLENNSYTVTSSGIMFKNATTSYTISSLSFKVTIAGYEYIVELQNVQVNPAVTLKSNGQTGLGSISLSEDGILELEYSTHLVPAFTNLYNFNVKASKYEIGDSVKSSGTIELYVVYAGIEYNVTSGNSISILIGNIGGNSTIINLEYKVKMSNGDNFVELTTTKGLTVTAFYIIEINYPQPNANTSFDVEYVPTNSKINLSDSGMGELPRVKVVDKNGNLVEFTINTNNEYEGILSVNNKTITILGVASTTIYELPISVQKSGSSDTIRLGTYRFVITESPYSVATVGMMPGVIYAGQGADNAFNYVDIKVKVPYEKIKDSFGSITANNSQTDYYTSFDIVSASYDGLTYTDLAELKTNVYYNPSEANNKYYSIAVTLEDFIKGVSANNIYIKYNDVYEKCTDVIINYRYNVTYMGELVDYCYYDKILEFGNPENDSEYEEENEYLYTQTVKYKQSTASDDNLAQISYLVVCDIVVNNIDESNSKFDIELNANEYDGGLSLVNLFNIAHYNGNPLWCNDVEENKKTLSLSYKESNAVATERAIRTEAQEFKVGSNNITYDYNINALGAQNNGTIVTYNLSYSVKEGSTTFEFNKELKIKVNSDIEFMLRNNDLTASDNSKDNSLKMIVGAEITLVNGLQTSGDGTAYYVYAYGKYNSVKTNIASRLKISVDGGDGFIKEYTVGNKYNKANGNVYMNYENQPTFGDKQVVVTFEDDYGFTFNYYITLEASSVVHSGSITNQTVYEGDSISVYNKNISNASGIGFIIKNQEGNNVTSDISLKKAEIVGLPELDFIVNDIAEGSKLITFNYAQDQDFWNNYGNGVQVQLTLRVVISKADDTSESPETYEKDFTIFYTKHYSLSIKDQNTFVRDGVSFDLENLVSVMDNKTSRYLGEPKLYESQALIFDDLEINKTYNYTTNGEFSYKFDYSDVEIDYKITKFNVFRMMQYVSGYNSASPSQTDFAVSYMNGAGESTIGNDVNDFVGPFAESVLLGLGIRYVGNDDDGNGIFTVGLNLEVTNKNTSSVQGITHYFTFKIYSIGGKDPVIVIKAISGDSSNYVILGEHQIESPLLNDVTFQNSTFALYTLVDGVEINGNNPTVVKWKENRLETEERTNGLKDIDKDTQKTIKQLDIAIADNAGTVPVFIKTHYRKQVGETEEFEDVYELHVEDITVPTTYTSMIVLDGDYIDKDPELFTGYYNYNEDSDVYTICDDNTTGTLCFNGLSLAGVKLAKNLKASDDYKISAYKIDGGTETYLGNTLSLENNNQSFTHSSLYNVDYQQIPVTLKYKLNNSTDYEYSFSGNINVTLKYTGINTDEAYVGTSSMHYITIGASENINNEEASVTGEGISISLTDWGSDFKLIPGVGKVAELAYLLNEDLSLTGADTDTGYLKYELSAIHAGDSQASSVAQINETSGLLTLTEGYMLNDYFITIKISCKYPIDATGTAGTDYNYKPIGTVNIGFRYTGTAS